jgi:hypothetical protein
LTGILNLEDRVGLPSFNAPFCEADHHGSTASHFEKHFASQIALRRLCANLHNDINESMSSHADTPVETSEDFSGPSISTLKQLASSLTAWRKMLPTELRWPEDDPTVFPPETFTSSVPNLNTAAFFEPHSNMFNTNLQMEPARFLYAYDVQVALLRTRYYYAKYMVYRPFVYKALHFPDQMTHEDAEGAAWCLKSCLRWPIAMSPTAHRKRLIPYLFCWSQNFLGMLLILHLSRYSPCLAQIRRTMCGPDFEELLEESVQLMLDWIRDLKESDPIAMWCWNVVAGVYQIED